MTQIGEYERHPLSAMFPDMPEEDYQELVASIDESGVRTPIMMLDDKILDGWHRYRAAKDAGLSSLEIHHYDVKEHGDPRRYVADQNIQRRHIPPYERALIMARLSEWRPSGINSGTIGADSTLTNHEMAQRAGVSERTIGRAKRTVRVERGQTAPESVRVRSYTRSRPKKNGSPTAENNHRRKVRLLVHTAREVADSLNAEPEDSPLVAAVLLAAPADSWAAQMLRSMRDAIKEEGQDADHEE